jgi:hypothetical protein
MAKITSAKSVRRIGNDKTQVELKVKSSDGHGRTVHMSVEEYEKLLRGEVIVKRIEDFTEEEVEAFLN